MKRTLCVLCLIFLFLSACSDDGSGSVSLDNGESGGVFYSASGHSPKLMSAVGGDYLVFSDSVNGTSAVSWTDLHTGKTFTLPLGTTAAIKELSSRDDGRVAWIVDGRLLSLDIARTSLAGDTSVTESLDTLASGIVSPRGLAMDSAGVYWGDSTSVMGLAFSDGMPDSASEPVTLASGVGALLRVAVSDGWLYFVESYDRPGGKIMRMDLDGFPGTVPFAESFADSLGSPYDITFTTDNVCWGEIDAPAAIWCKSKDGGSAWEVSPDFPIPLTVSALGSSGNTLFYRDSIYILRYSTDGSDSNGVVAKVSGVYSSSFSENFVVADGTLYWRDGYDIRSVSASNAIDFSSPVSGSTKCQYSYNGTASTYGGAYFGQFVYKTRLNDTSAWTSRAISVNLTMNCVAKMDTGTVLNITWAKVNDPYFGCQWGCTPLTGSVATLPEPPANSSSPSAAGDGIVVLFPNGATLVTANAAGELTISSDGGTISSSLNAGDYGDGDVVYAWDACSTVTGTSCFPVFSATAFATADATYPSWVLDKSAL